MLIIIKINIYIYIANMLYNYYTIIINNKYNYY